MAWRQANTKAKKKDGHPLMMMTIGHNSKGEHISRNNVSSDHRWNVFLSNFDIIKTSQSYFICSDKE